MTTAYYFLTKDGDIGVQIIPTGELYTGGAACEWFGFDEEVTISGQLKSALNARGNRYTPEQTAHGQALALAIDATDRRIEDAFSNFPMVDRN